MLYKAGQFAEERTRLIDDARSQRDAKRNQRGDQHDVNDGEGHSAVLHRHAFGQFHQGCQHIGKEDGYGKQEQRVANGVDGTEQQRKQEDCPNDAETLGGSTPSMIVRLAGVWHQLALPPGNGGCQRPRRNALCATSLATCRISKSGSGRRRDEKIEKQHRDGKLTARERIGQLIDPGTLFLEIGLLIAYDRYDGQAPGAGVVTGGKIEGRPAVIVANDATVKAGAWWPETITKILRAQEIAMRNRAADRLPGGFGGRESAAIRTASSRASTARRASSITTR